MTINKTVENGKAIITPEGHIDTLTAPELEGVIKEILPGAKELILDFEKIGYISSAGLRVLLSAQKAMNEQGEMKLCHVNDAVNDIFEVTGFSDILTIE